MDNLSDVVTKACEESSLVGALSFVAVWENDRAVKQALRNEPTVDGKLWDTCFKRCFEEVFRAWVLKHTGESLPIDKKIVIVIEDRSVKHVDLLYKLARHLRNTDAVPITKWAVHGMDLLAELREFDPVLYDSLVKGD